MWDPVPRPGMEPRPLALGAWSLRHWATREVPILLGSYFVLFSVDLFACWLINKTLFKPLICKINKQKLQLNRVRRAEGGPSCPMKTAEPTKKKKDSSSFLARTHSMRIHGLFSLPNFLFLAIKVFSFPSWGGNLHMGSCGCRPEIAFLCWFHWRGKWQPTPVFLPGESQGQGSLLGYSPWGHKESDTTEVT